MVIVLNSEAEWLTWKQDNMPDNELYIVPKEYPATLEWASDDRQYYNIQSANSFQCGCKICNESKRRRQILERADIKEMQSYIEGLSDRVMELDADVEYYTSLMQGQWPDGKEVLRLAILKYPSTISSIPGPNFDTGEFYSGPDTPM